MKMKMGRRLALILASLAALCSPAFSQEVPQIEFFALPDSLTAEYLDSLEVPSAVKTNDYWMVGAFGGGTLINGYWNPPRTVSTTPLFGAYGVSVIKYTTMLNMFRMVGLEFGLQKTYEGYFFKENKETGLTPNIMGSQSAKIDVYEANLLAHFHFDIGDHFKLMIKGGLYGGYRYRIHREGPYVREQMEDDFVMDLPTNGDQVYSDERLTYGVEAGLGFGVMFDPVEIHIGALGKWGWREYHNPNYLSPYYYRFSYPFDIMLQVGVYYQLTPRHGHTRRELRRMARNIVQSSIENENNPGSGR